MAIELQRIQTLWREAWDRGARAQISCRAVGWKGQVTRPNRAALPRTLLAFLPGMSSFATYFIGFVILIVGLALAAFYLNVPVIWIGIGVVVLIGIGVLKATTSEKPRDPPKA